MRLVFEDEFDGPLNSSRWNVLEQVHRGGVYTRGNVQVQDGVLVLKTVAQNMTIDQGGVPTRFYVSSGAVNSSGLFERRLGRWEVRAKLPLVSASPGFTLHSSIWLFADEHRPGRSGCPQEIDVVEQYEAGPGSVASRASGNLHPFAGADHNGTGGCSRVDYERSDSNAVGDWTSHWTTFAVDWTENWIALRVNGVTYANWHGPGTAAALAAFTEPLFLALTACVMDRVPIIALDALPLHYFIDSVRYYEWSPT